jgi:hypothetical protein
MRTCWANSLGGCGKISGEHILSRSILPTEGMKVYDFPGFEGQPKIISRESFRFKNLCGNHNSELSPCDSEAGRLVDAFDEAGRLANVRASLRKTQWRITRFPVDGLLLERWFVKTLINLATLHQTRKNSPDVKFVLSREDMVRIAFGRQGFRGKAGLYGVGRTGMQTPRDKVGTFTVLDGDRVAMGMFSVWGFRFILSLLESGVPSRFPVPTAVQDDGWYNVQALYHVKQYNELVQDRLSHIIQFNWPPA